MSQSSTVVGGIADADRADGRSGESECRVQDVLAALTDADCRSMLEAIGDGDGARSAAELSEVCDVPLSTAYRKLDRLSEAGLLEERLRIRRSGHHETVYDRRIDDVRIAIDSDDGIELHVSRRETTGRSEPVAGW